MTVRFSAKQYGNIGVQQYLYNSYLYRYGTNTFQQLILSNFIQGYNKQKIKRVSYNKFLLNMWMWNPFTV